MMRRVLLLAVLGAAVCVPPAMAQDGAWSLRLNGYYVDPGDTPTVSVGDIFVVSTDNNSGAGIGISAEYRINERFGVELGLMAADHGDFYVVIDPPGTRLKVNDTLTIQMIAGGLNIHLTPASKVDVYVGPLLAIIGYTNLTVDIDLPELPIELPIEIPTSTQINIESDLGFGLNLGMDVPLGDRGWIFNANLRYLLTSADATIENLISESIDYDPLLIGVGFGYRF